MRFLLPGVLVATIASSLAAQDPPPSEERTRTFGIGVQFSPIAFFFDEEFGITPPGIGNLLFPIRVSPNLTLEPEIGILRFSSTSDGGGGVPPNSSTFSNLRIGLGILGQIGADGPVRTYVGARLARLSVSTEFDGSGTPTTTTRVGWMMAGVLGGQHFFTPSFSLGGEIQLSRTAFGEPEVEGGGGFGDEKLTFTGTNGVVTLRWFP